MCVKQTKQKRAGVTTFEVMVAATLLLASLSIFGPLAIRIGRTLQETRQVRLATEELSNQLEGFHGLTRSEIEHRLTSLATSEQLGEVLTNARLSGRVLEDDQPLGIELSLTWDRVASAKPLVLVGWPHVKETSVMPDQANEDSNDKKSSQETGDQP